jgi:hypothetical protein
VRGEEGYRRGAVVGKVGIWVRIINYADKARQRASNE